MTVSVLIAHPENPHVTLLSGIGIEPVHVLAVDLRVALSVEAAHPGAALPLAFRDGSHIRYMVALKLS